MPAKGLHPRVPAKILPMKGCEASGIGGIQVDVFESVWLGGIRERYRPVPRGIQGQACPGRIECSCIRGKSGTMNRRPRYASEVRGQVPPTLTPRGVQGNQRVQGESRSDNLT